MPFDLILRGGRVVDPSQKLDTVTDVAFAGDKVAMIGNELKADPGPMCVTYRVTSSPPV
jgi:dihydroorotase